MTGYSPTFLNFESRQVRRRKVRQALRKRYRQWKRFQRHQKKGNAR